MRWLFAFVWRRWLWNFYSQCPNRVVKVTGWRSCITDTPSGQRVHATFMVFPWEKER